MAWNQPNGGNGGGPWKPRSPSPWGQNNGGGTSPDLEDLLRRGGERLKRVFPGQSGGGGRLPLVIVAFVVVGWLVSGFYTVQPNEVGLNQVFGRYVGKTGPGLNYNWPYPIGSVAKPQVSDRNSIDIGFRQTGRSDATVDLPEESLMLTGDQNIADVKFRVVWQIDPARPEDFVFNLRNPRETVKAVSESAMRELVGRTTIQALLTNDRSTIEPAAQGLIQSVLDRYQAGVSILQVQLQPVDPPQQVLPYFRDVTVAQQDRDRASNEAQTYANRVVPEARGNAARIVQEAEAYKEQTIAQATGQAAAFSQIYDTYRASPDLTRERIYLETMERVLGGADKVIVDSNANGVVPLLPLNNGPLSPILGQPAATGTAAPASRPTPGSGR